MGLDLLVMPKPKLGFESEFNKFIKRVAAEDEIDEKEREHFEANTIASYATLGAPRVGEDPSADAWILAKCRKDGDNRNDSAIIDEFRGSYVLELLQDCDGIPPFSNSAVFAEICETSFRGSFLQDCTTFLDKKTLERAWTAVMTPEEAVDYGNVLLQHASRPEPDSPAQVQGWLSKLFVKPRTAIAIAEQREILDAAGRWYTFWGKRGHHIEAYC